MPWEKQYNEDVLLERAMQAFWARGYEATSINNLVDATGVNRGSLYAAFSGKRQIFVRALEFYDKKFREDFLGDLLATHSPKEAILAAFHSVVIAADDGNDRNGCLLINTALEMSPHDSEIEKLVSEKLKMVENFFHESLRAAKEDGSVDAKLDLEKTGHLLYSLFLGVRVITRSKPDNSVIESILGQVEALLT